MSGNPPRPRTVEAHVGLVRQVAHRWRWACQGALELDDLVQAGTLGLMRALELFDPAHGATFSTYATHWIRQAIQRRIQNEGRTVRVPVHEQDRRRRNGQPLPCSTVSSDAPLWADGSSTIGDSFATDWSDPENAAAAAEAGAAIRDAMAALPERFRRILHERFFLDMTLEEVGAGLGLTRERTRQLQASALALLRPRMLLLHPGSHEGERVALSRRVVAGPAVPWVGRPENASLVPLRASNRHPEKAVHGPESLDHAEEELEK